MEGADCVVAVMRRMRSKTIQLHGDAVSEDVNMGLDVKKGWPQRDSRTAGGQVG